jgi:hypothetical protein
MGALPKNKITRAERGKRRRGNTPTLTKDAKVTSIPLHKRGLVAQMRKSIGLDSTAKK